MILSLPTDELKDYVRAQTNHFFPDKYDFTGADVDAAFETALQRTENCFSQISVPGYHDATGNELFSHLHGDQYASFIYFLSNSLWNYSQNKALCDKLLLLNRTLFTLFISYKCPMPEHFLLGHAYGTILGNAQYSDYLVVFQGVTVNTATDAQGNPAPKLGKGLFLGAHSKIIGAEPVGDRVSISVDTMVYNKAIPDDSVVIRDEFDACKILPRKKPQCMAQNYFNVEI